MKRSTDCRHGLPPAECAMCRRRERLGRRDLGPRSGSAAAVVLEFARLYGGQEFSLGQLALRAWAAYPAQFGLEPCPNMYPDSRKVHNVLCGAKGLVRRGFLTRVGPDRYRVVKEG